ncbi:MAG TPA: hypothetical protein PLR28_11195, partial [Dokdonella sp.]|nr:hypothetical protein [Dokdonella sp.]
TPTTATASSAAASYAATNALLRPVLREWRSTTTGASWLQLDLGASLSVTGVALSGANFSSCTILADNSATPTTNRGTLTTALDKQDRRKGSLAFAATVRYIRFNLGAGTPLDGAAYWSIGSGYAFAGALSLLRDPLYGGSSVDWTKPQQRNDLPNGVIETWATGADRAEIALQFAGRETEDIEEIVRRARAGVCWFDFGLAAERGMQWPVTHCEDVVSTRMEGFNRRRLDARLREVA